ncbi:hypothetical protein [Comamonas guangdongensis]|uniref:Uncharacterized protein n=1 Tax=Comamonas guangdongensis TaxID=510515 RepID=A0ABV3ZYT1_9BURK
MADSAHLTLVSIIRPKPTFEQGEDMKPQMTTIARVVTTLVLPAALVACGGGSGSGSGGEQPKTSTLKISGTAATGAAMGGAAINAICATGSGTATAGPDGSYIASINDGALPCVLSASSGGTTLHSILGGSGQASSATANITPLSELLIAQFAGSSPKSFADAFGSGTQVNPSDIAAAQTALLQALTAAGVDTSSAGDIVGGALLAGSGTGYDGVLDKLQDMLKKAGSQLSDLTAIVATSSQLGDTKGLSSVMNTALAPAASDCPGLKTGKLRYVNISGSGSGTLDVDVAAMTIGGQALTGSACDYTVTVNSSTTRILVSRSGAAFMLTGSGLSGAAAIAVPEQNLSLAALAGSYNRVGYSQSFDTQVGDYGDTEFSADGVNGLSHNCPSGANACVPDSTAKGTLVANPNGGFDYTEQGSVSDRVFAFRNSSGKTMLLAQSTDLSNPAIAAMVSKGKLALPAVGDTSSYWQVMLNATGVVPQPDDTNTIATVDSASGVVTRSFGSDGHTDTLTYNIPFDGTRYRARNACTGAGGQGTGSCSGTVQLPFGGMTLTTRADTNISNRFFSVSIGKP